VFLLDSFLMSCLCCCCKHLIFWKWGSVSCFKRCFKSY